LDTFLQRLAWSSQIILVIAGIFGYFFTVRPVHQKQLLDEQIAERTISLKNATHTLQNLQAEANRLQNENVQLGTEASRLRTEANQTYEQLRSNIVLDVLSFPAECATRKDLPNRITQNIPSCALKFITQRISANLKTDDKSLLIKITERHTAEMLNAGSQVDKKFADRSKKIEREIKSTEADLENSTAAVRTEILQLRIARAGGRAVEPDPPTGRIIIRTEEDQRAYDNYVARRTDLAIRLDGLQREKIFFDVDFEEAHRKALSQIASQILREFRTEAKQP